ncbi:hypothetical protein CO652_25800 [Rhizobium sp. H4]|uniref:hypothetical protein n=1 Tax=Rhizobium TaxID=379 RepID=UPI000BE856F5|nr:MULTISPECIES: hypothetical protein [Rhizobium]PDV85665.1 hypothetical protein CO652_25800 [Rhizobium sp. H4]WET73225.1 hypothetical protein PYR68_17540 [Rhizobium croatiense]
MAVEPIGIITMALGLYCLALGQDATIKAFVTLTLLGAAAAFVLGSSSVQPAHVFLMFVAVAVMRSKRPAAPLFDVLHFGQPGFWLACLVLYGGLSAYFLPRLFADATTIIPLGIPEQPLTGGVASLGPVSSNLTQTVYLTADLVCFTLIVAIGSTLAGFRAIVIGLIAYAILNIVFALVDVVTGALGAQDVLQFIRNAQYTFHDNDKVNGMKRIVGSWPEASAFAGTTLGAFGFTATTWLCQRHSHWTGPLAVTSLMLIILSTSSAGLVAAPVGLAILYATAVRRSGTGPGSSHSAAVAVLAPLLVLLAGLVILLQQDIFNTVHNYVDLLILSKSTSSSGLTRGSWNTYGLQNFLDTFGLGVGLGTARTSSFPVALLSNVGVPGALFFLMFAITALAPGGAPARSYVADIRLAARNGCLCLLAGSMVVGPTVDLGLLFFILAGLAASRPATIEATAPFLRLHASRDMPEPRGST